MSDSRLDFYLSIIGIFVVLVTAWFAYQALLELGIIPVLTFAIKSFLLGSCIGVYAFEKRGKDFKLTSDVWFLIGFTAIAITAPVLLTMMNILLSTLFFFVVGFMFVYSGAASAKVKADDFVVITGVAGILIFILALATDVLTAAHVTVLNDPVLSLQIVMVASILIPIVFAVFLCKLCADQQPY